MPYHHELVSNDIDQNHTSLLVNLSVDVPQFLELRALCARRDALQPCGTANFLRTRLQPAISHACHGEILVPLLHFVDTDPA